MEKTMTVRLDEELMRKFNDICDEKLINKSALFRRLIADWCQKELEKSSGCL